MPTCLKPKPNNIDENSMWQETLSQLSEAESPLSKSLPKIYSIPIAAEALAHYSRELQIAEPAEALCRLTQAIACSPSWAEMPPSVLIARPTPEPVLAVLGCFDEVAKFRIWTQLQSLNRDLARMRYVSYGQAELDCQRLAYQLIDRFGHEELKRFHFTGIPRGGLIVLGMLAYCLGLTSEQLQPPKSPDVPWVVVDDCVYTGSRFYGFVQSHSQQKMIFAHLYSHPELRSRIITCEPHVLACVSAHDVYDYAPEELGDDYQAWQKHSLFNLSGFRYWVGKTDHVCFSWNEPDRFFWNSITEKIEGSWLLLPKDVCLKNQFKGASKLLNVQIQPGATGSLKPAAQVVFGQYGEQIVIGNLETQQSFGLTDLAADIWLAIVEHGNLEEVITVLLKIYDINETTLRSDVDIFIDQLYAEGLLIKLDDR
ncbi:hypothetical protein DP113_16690 [Brasilonema octagenarum UFV-E1]|uniref:PqqD family peptide modification chaperone n=2 Tax=Bromeliae group (in: Brasilonema) TaxID=3398495 RepID=A0A856MDS6_9CYAN|nr:hypothetical protein DP114_16755 [Brasilonema sennae CENA114]QDL15690.1 hypothetical protein DP113_16690 [Brasilonema octagenarum UFV-E1]